MVLDKRKIHHYLRVAYRLKTWQLLIILILMLFVSATFLRLNNLGMVERRNAVIAADKTGDEQKIVETLDELRRYVNAHMNTGLGNGVYLEESYRRDYGAALERATTSTNPSSAVYQQASVECQSRFGGGRESFRNDYVQCVVERVGSLTQAEDPTAGVNLPKADAYRHDFVSPVISLDAAGLAVFLSLLITTVIVVRLLIVIFLKALLQRRYR